MQGNPIGLILRALAVLAWLVHAIPAHAQDVASPLEDPTGFWLVAETGPPVNQGIASIPLLGLAVRAQIGNPRAIWEIRREGDGYSIEIPSRSLAFKGLAFGGRKFHAEAPDTGTPSGKIVLDATIADGRLTGRLAYPNYAFELDGRLPESVEALRQAYAAASGRLAEIDGPYVVPEIEKLRQENLVLIERIRRVEGELRQRGSSPRTSGPESAATTPRISMRGVVADLSTARPTALRATPEAAGAVVSQLAGGTPLVRLGEATARGWLLVADARGTVGYVQSTQTATATPGSAAMPRATREISISFPQWDAGRAGKRMGVAEPGFVSIVGRVRGDAPLRDVRISDAQTVFNPDGSFTSVLPVPREGRKVRIDATFASGPPAVLEFEIHVTK